MRSRRWKTLALAGVAACLCAPGAGGQPRPSALPLDAMLTAVGGDPLQANPMGLLARTEVETALHLDIRQKADLREALASPPAAADGIQGGIGVDPRVLRNLPPAERQARLEELRRARLEAQRPQMPHGDLTPRVREILRPDQATRLGELDLQYRGPLALADPAVAQRAKLSTEHKAAIAKLAADYTAKRNELFGKFLQDMTERGAFRRDLPAPDLTRAFAPVRREVVQARKDAEEKALSALDAEEAQRWKDLQGAAFTFRSDATTPIRPS